MPSPFEEMVFSECRDQTWSLCRPPAWRFAGLFPLLLWSPSRSESFGPALLVNQRSEQAFGETSGSPEWKKSSRLLGAGASGGGLRVAVPPVHAGFAAALESREWRRESLPPAPGLLEGEARIEPMAVPR